jgi:membrane glycosyltransferase
MRRAGCANCVLPEEDLGWEENPPTLIEFIRRDQRWCQVRCNTAASCTHLA